MSSPIPKVRFADIKAAQKRIAPFVHRTPVLTSTQLDVMSGAKLFFKCENFQKAGVFKARGAHSAVFALSEADAKKGVLTHSSGNHGAGLALAAQRRGILCTVIVPEDSLKIKVANIARYGGRVVYCKTELADREAVGNRELKFTGAYFIHPCDNPVVIAGQGTVALELVEDVPDLEIVVVPVGGGGLASGTCIVAKGLNPKISVLGAEPLGADDAARSFAARKLISRTDPDTICDGLRAGLSEGTFGLLRTRLDQVVTISESDVIESTWLVWSIMKIIIEPSAAVVVALALKHPELVRGKRVGLILSGGNVDLERLPWLTPGKPRMPPPHP